MDSLHEGSLRVQDFDEQKRLADRIQLLFFQDQPQVYSGIFFMPSGYRASVRNVPPSHPGQPEYNNVSLSRSQGC